MSEAADAAPATLITLGRLGFDAPHQAGAARLLSQPKRLAVLLYVLLSARGGSASRDRVIGVFWPESDASRARNALRQTLSFLRTCLGSDALGSVGNHRLTVSHAIACDALRFETLLDANHKEEALQLYRGEFLPGFHVDGSHAFSEWLEARRRHLGQRAAKAAWDLTDECEARGEGKDAAFWGKRALALSPFSESEVQRVLRLLTRVGDFAGAMRAFRGLQILLQGEFGSEPSAETARLAADITERLHSDGQDVPALLGTRRTGVERRAAQRRCSQAEFEGEERRSAPERRDDERRSGVDRRDVR